MHNFEEPQSTLQLCSLLKTIILFFIFYAQHGSTKNHANISFYLICQDE